MKKIKKPRHIGDYLDKDSGQSVNAEIQWKGCVKHQRITEELKRMRAARDVFENSGLHDAAKHMQSQINDKEMERKNLELQLNEERREMAFTMLVCLAACDVATVCAEDLAATMHRVSKGIVGTTNDFSEAVKEQAKSFNILVQSVDEGGNLALSNYYADIAEEVIAKVKPVMMSVIREHHNTARGRRYF